MIVLDRLHGARVARERNRAWQGQVRKINFSKKPELGGGSFGFDKLFAENVHAPVALIALIMQNAGFMVKCEFAL